jgi:hypothetical protein
MPADGFAPLAGRHPDRAFPAAGGRRRWSIGILVVFLVSDAGAQITGAAIPFYGAGL